MNEKTYSITLSNGTVINDLKLNGNNFVSKSELTEEIFAGNCSPVVINDGESDETHNNMTLVQITQVEDEYWFILRDISEIEIERIKMQADIEYIAMMSEIML